MNGKIKHALEVCERVMNYACKVGDSEWSVYSGFLEAREAIKAAKQSCEATEQSYEAMEAIKTGQAITVDENGIRLINFELDFKVFGIAAHDINKGDKVLFSLIESTPDILIGFPKGKFMVIQSSV